MKSEYVLIHAAPIKHYGIKGQKKGVRRFQLDNGELTAAGKSRYGVSKKIEPSENNNSKPETGRKKNITGSISGAVVNKNDIIKPETGRKKNITGSISGAVVNKIDNGEILTKKKKLVKIKTVDGIKRR